MDENAPVHTNGPVNLGRHAGNRPGIKSRFNRLKKFKLKHVAVTAGAVLLIIAVALGVMFFYRSSTGANIDGNKYQAVFLSNGQVYFGKLTTLNSEYMRLTDIFYLQTKASNSSNPQETSSASDVQLIKLGSEVHGPDDQMIVSKTQILFFENLKSDGTVAKSIVKYHKQ